MAWITADDLLDDLARMLKVASADDLEDYWAGIAADAVLAAQDDIRAALIGRGYTTAQVDAWDRGATFHTDIGLYWALVKGGGLQGYDDRFIARLDRRAELATVLLTEDGGLVDPDAAADAVGYGTLDTTDDTYTRDTAW